MNILDLLGHLDIRERVHCNLRNRDIRNACGKGQVRHDHIPHMPVQKSRRADFLSELSRSVFSNHLCSSTSLPQTVPTQHPSIVSRSAQHYSTTRPQMRTVL